jgi:hypothetical protein
MYAVNVAIDRWLVSVSSRTEQRRRRLVVLYLVDQFRPIVLDVSYSFVDLPRCHLASIEWSQQVNW